MALMMNEIRPMPELSALPAPIHNTNIVKIETADDVEIHVFYFQSQSSCITIKMAIPAVDRLRN